MNGSGWPVFSAVFLVVLLVLGGGYYILQVYTPPVSATAPVTPEARQFGLHLHASEMGQDVVRSWMPPVIVVNAGDSVILRITNTDPEAAHGFALGAFNIAVSSISPGETVTVRFKATKPGIYHYGCMLAGCSPDHIDQTGQLVVLRGQ